MTQSFNEALDEILEGKDNLQHIKCDVFEYTHLVKKDLKALISKEIIGQDEPDKVTKAYNQWPSDGNEKIRNSLRHEQR